MSTAMATTLEARREAIVRRHVESEQRHDFAAAVATFHHPRYEVAPLGIADGAEGVTGLLNGILTGFPDWEIIPGPIRHGSDFVLTEVQMKGTHLGPFAGWEPTGRKMDLPVACIFEFEDDRLMCEKVYFDMATVMRQLGRLE